MDRPKRCGPTRHRSIELRRDDGCRSSDSIVAAGTSWLRSTGRCQVCVPSSADGHAAAADGHGAAAAGIWHGTAAADGHDAAAADGAADNRRPSWSCFTRCLCQPGRCHMPHGSCAPPYNAFPFPSGFFFCFESMPIVIRLRCIVLHLQWQRTQVRAIPDVQVLMKVLKHFPFHFIPL